MVPALRPVVKTLCSQSFGNSGVICSAPHREPAPRGDVDWLMWSFLPNSFQSSAVRCSARTSSHIDSLDSFKQ